MIASLRRTLKRDPHPPGFLHLRIQIVLHNRAGARRFVIKESLSSYP